MQKNASYWKARLDAIMQLIIEEKGGDRSEKNNHSVLLRNGIVPEAFNERYKKAFNRHHQAWLRSRNSQPLSFDEVSRFNTWFAMHPEKVAGKEIITTSVHFPISIKGTKEDIVATIQKTLKNNSDRIRMAKVKAKAKLKLLVLMKI